MKYPLLPSFTAALWLACQALPANALPRDAQQAQSFKNTTICPSTGKIEKKVCPGYDVDHKQALMNNGADRPDNMQYLAKDAHKAKTKQDIQDCQSSYLCKSKRLAKPVPFTEAAKRREARDLKKAKKAAKAAAAKNS